MQVAVFAQGTRVFQATALGDQPGCRGGGNLLRLDPLLEGAAAMTLTGRLAPAGRRDLPGLCLRLLLLGLLRAVTATLAPVFSAELDLRAADLGLLAGAYFFGFAAMQLPLGRALDRFGPRRTLLALLALAVLGCAALPGARAARAGCGAGADRRRRGRLPDGAADLLPAAFQPQRRSCAPTPGC
jgi:hypothetical protein